jgi:transcriptional regulator with XRE-family HTH domain
MTESNHRYSTLAEYLASSGVGQGNFARRVGISSSYVSLIANRQRTPSLALAARIAAEANIPIESLLTPSEAA